jgi:hypothetical protein
MRKKKTVSAMGVILVVACAALVLVPAEAEADSCFGILILCYQQVDDWLTSCVTGNYWHDIGCGVGATVFQIGCGAEYITCTVGGLTP